MTYSPELLDHVNRPRNVGSLRGDDRQVGTGVAEGETCGDVVRLQIRVDRASGVIAAVRFKAYGCGPAIASASLASEWLEGRTAETALEVEGVALARALGLPASRTHGSLLAAQAIRAAVADYRGKQAAGPVARRPGFPSVDGRTGGYREGGRT